MQFIDANYHPLDRLPRLVHQSESDRDLIRGVMEVPKSLPSLWRSQSWFLPRILHPAKAANISCKLINKAPSSSGWSFE